VTAAATLPTGRSLAQPHCSSTPAIDSRLQYAETIIIKSLHNDYKLEMADMITLFITHFT